MEVVLSVEKHRHIAEINLHATGVRIHSREESSDMYASVDAVLEKLTRQVRKYKDRINRHQPLTDRELRMYQHAVVVPEPVNGDQHAEPTQESQHQVVQREKLPMKPMTLDEAILQFELVEEPFLVFTNAETSQVNVLYSRGDGSYGLIEPEF